MRSVYLHGNPGGPDELPLMGGEAVGSWFAPDRSTLPLEPEARLSALVVLIAEACGDEPFRLVGFSAGAHVALQVAARMPDTKLVLHLVSPAGPLETGDYLDAMAGGPVFRAAMKHPRLFSALVLAQSLSARAFPRLLMRMLFSTAQGGDKGLLNDARFTRRYQAVLQHCVITGRASYQAEIEAYVRPWAGLLAEVGHPVTIWQGSCDNWTPPEMAKAMARLLPNLEAFHLLEGQSHFSALRAALSALA